MQQNNRYSPLKSLSLLMALDAAGAAALLAVYLLGTLTQAAGAAQGIPMDTAVVSRVMTWSIWGLRVLVWSLILACLTPLTGEARTNGFRRARVWYLWRLLTAAMETFPPSVLAYRYSGTSAAPPTPQIISALLCSAVIGFLGETVMLTLGIRSVLHGGAELLDACGIEEQAEKNRRCGRFLVGFAAARLIPLSAAAVLAVWAGLTKGAALFLDAESMAVIVFLAAVLFLLSVPGGAGGLLFQFAAAVRMRRTYSAIEDLTR